MVSPTHVPFEGKLKDKMTMTGRSVVVWQGKDIPFVCADFSKVKAGKYQKHADAKCKVTGRDIILFDEPTSGLDYYHMLQVSDILKRLKEEGKSVIIVTHDTELIEKACTRTIVLE